MIKAREVLALTGLSADQLREWTTRRGLIQPDLPSRGKGVHAQFSWQTVLLLRLAAVLRSRFRVELQGHRELLAQIRAKLDKVPFHSLWGAVIVLADMRLVEVVDATAMRIPGAADFIVLHLDAHLEVLSRGFALSEPLPQLQLFPAWGVS